MLTLFVYKVVMDEVEQTAVEAIDSPVQQPVLYGGKGQYFESDLPAHLPSLKGFGLSQRGPPQAPWQVASENCDCTLRIEDSPH